MKKSTEKFSLKEIIIITIITVLFTALFAIAILFEVNNRPVLEMIKVFGNRVTQQTIIMCIEGLVALYFSIIIISAIFTIYDAIAATFTNKQ